MLQGLANRKNRIIHRRQEIEVSEVYHRPHDGRGGRRRQSLNAFANAEKRYWFDVFREID